MQPKQEKLFCLWSFLQNWNLPLKISHLFSSERIDLLRGCQFFLFFQTYFLDFFSVFHIFNIFWDWKTCTKMWGAPAEPADSYYQIRPESTDVPNTRFKIKVSSFPLMSHLIKCCLAFGLVSVIFEIGDCSFRIFADFILFYFISLGPAGVVLCFIPFSCVC